MVVQTDLAGEAQHGAKIATERSGSAIQTARVRHGEAHDLGPAGLFEPVFYGWRNVANWIGIFIWIACLVYFGQWWFDSAHVYTYPRFIAVSVAVFWVALIPAYFIFIFAFAKVPKEELRVAPAWRIATVVTKAPSEPLSVVKNTLLGCLNQQDIEHDVWLADEAPSEETLAWCRAHGVKVSSRQGDPAYHNRDWPRRTRSKEGNLAYFYDHFGYREYDFVSQFDADHVPTPGYLKHAVAPFVDRKVGYVSAPSICDANAGQSWAARGRLYVEASMHGALQVGYNAGWAPLCIGSHYTVRTAALKEIGGLGPELAEDHSTTLFFNAGGWRGVHAVQAIAHGAGPETFTDLVIQEFQWSRSLVTILMRYSPDCVPKLKGRLRFQFLFSQFWYPMFSTVMAAMYLMPIIALVTRTPMINTTYIEFFIHMLPLSLAILVLAYWWRSTGMFRPADAKILSWEGGAFIFLRWPWSLFGSLAAVYDRIRGQVADFRVTPKGMKTTEPLPFRIIGPYLLLALAPALTAWLIDDAGTAAGFYLFNIINAIVYGGLALVVLFRHSLENGLGFIPRTLGGAANAALVVAVAASLGGAMRDNALYGLAAWNEGITAFSLTRPVYSFSGAGHLQSDKPVLRFAPRWRTSS